MPDVFLSYKREDLKAATRLVEALRAEGLDLWWDRDIPASAPWEATIEAALSEARVVLVLWSKAAVASDNVRSEARWAREQGRLIQLFVELCKPPLFFGEHQGIDLAGWSGDPEDGHFKELAATLRERLGRAAEPPVRQVRRGFGAAMARRLRTPKTAILAASLVLGLVVLAASAWIARGILFTPAPAATRIAVAPIDAPTASPWVKDFAGGVSDQILSVLSTRQTPTLSGPEAASLGDAAASTQARKLGVRLVISGDARDDGAGATVDIHFVDPASRAALWSVTFSTDRSKTDEMRAQIAAKIAAMLDCGSRALRPTGGLKDPEALSSYLKACDLFQTFGYQFEPEPSFQLFAALRRVIAVAPRFAPAYSDLAKYEAYYAHYIPFSADQAASLRKDAKVEADRALALDPKSADAYVALSFLVPRPGWAQRERLLRQAIAADPDWPHGNGFLGMLLWEVGRVQEAAVYGQHASAANPLSSELGWTSESTKMLAAAGRLDQAEANLTQLMKLWPNDGDVWSSRFAVAVDAGRWDDALNILSAPGRPAIFQPEDVAEYKLVLQAAKSRAPDQLAAARRFVLARTKTAPVLASQEIQNLSILGDLDDAFALAYSPGAMAVDGPYQILFSPPTRPMRLDPRFIALAAHLGLVDYWRSTGKWPDFCSEPSLPYDCKAEAAKPAPPRSPRAPP